MESYENAPATRLLATHCAVCGRPLVDAKSVELGIGPDCRKKYGFDAPIPESARTRANQLVYLVALEQKGPAVNAAVLELHALGLPVLAARLIERLGGVRIAESGPDGTLLVDAPYREEAVPEWRAVHGRVWDRQRQVNVVPPVSRRQLWALLKRCYAGSLAVGPKGPFVIA